jgi:dihydroxyacid dehydratase/phosphogluconate dehydratase
MNPIRLPQTRMPRSPRRGPPQEPKELKLNQELNRRSHVITDGDAGAPRRAQLRAVNFKDGDWDKPIVGVLNLHSTMNPCNAGIQPLVDSAGC